MKSRVRLTVLAGLALAGAARAGLQVQTLGTVSAVDLAQALVGQGVTISNVTYQGISWGAGTFFGGTDSVGFDAGVVLSTGSVLTAPGPNWQSEVTSSNSRPGDPQLDLLAGMPTNDAASLEFDFVTATNEASLEFVFASDEYNEYLGSYNDVFAFYLDGVNIALVPGTTLPVSVNTINGSVNPGLYLNNDGSGTMTIDTQYDGLTRVLQYSGTVTAGVTHHIKFVIADGMDGTVDSAVFLRAASFTALKRGLVVRKSATPFVAPGDPLEFTITVENIGDGTAYNVEAWDTIPANTTLTALPPPGVNNGGILVWAFGDLGPGLSVQVTFTVQVNGGVAAVVNRAGGLPAGGYGLCNGGTGAVTLIPILSIYSEPMATELERPIPCLHLSASTTDFNAPCPGTVVRYELGWGNCGRQTIDGLTLIDTLPAGASWIGGSLGSWAAPDGAGQPVLTVSEWAPSPAGPWTPGEPPDGTTAPALVRWAVDRVAPGFSGAVRYDMTVGASPPDDLVSNRAHGTVAGDPVAYPAWSGLYTGPEVYQYVANSATIVEVGAPMLLNVKTQNRGCRQAVNVGVSVWCDLGGPATAALPDPVAVLAPGEVVWFTITMTASAPGPFALTSRLSYTNTATGKTMEKEAVVPRRMAFEGPVLSARLAAPLAACAGTGHLLRLTVSNSGNTPAVNVTTTALRGWGPGSTTTLVGPWPAGPLTIDPGATVVLTWTATAGTPGAVTWSVTVGGHSGLSGYALHPRPAGTTGLVTSGGAITAALSLPATAWVGQWVTVTLTVTETAGSAVSLGIPAGPFSPACNVRAGPNPATAVLLPPNGTQFYTWTVSVSGSGGIVLSVTVGGVNCSGVAVVAVAGAACAVPVPATLRGALSLSATTVLVGDHVTVVLTMTNSGVSDSLNTVPTLGWTGPPAALFAGPSPALATIPGGTMASFTWTVSASGSGLLNLTAAGAGVDSVGGNTVACPPVGGTVRVLKAAALVVEIIQLLPTTAPSGSTLTGLVRIRNTGEMAATVFIPVATAPGVPATGFGPPVLVAPLTVTRLEGGAAVDYTWTVTTGGCGQVRLSVTAEGVESWTGRVLPAMPALSPAAAVLGVPANLSITPDKATAVCGANASVTAVLTDNCGNPVAGRTVGFSVDRGGTAIHRTVVTDANGVAKANLALGYDPGPSTVGVTLVGTPVSATCVINVTLPATALATPGAALDRNLYQLSGGNRLMIRLYPVSADPVVARIYSASGRLLRTLGTMEPVGGGRYAMFWDGLNNEGEGATAGVYIVRVTGGGLNETLKLVVR